MQPCESLTTFKSYNLKTKIVMARPMRATQVIKSTVSKTYYVYILASRRNGTLYIGVTNDLWRRVHEHREGSASDFTRKYGVKQFVYFEDFGHVNDAINRETRLKKYKREWKINLIQKQNIGWRDLAADWYPGLDEKQGCHGPRMRATQVVVERTGEERRKP